jgi:hypothetical protein
MHNCFKKRNVYLPAGFFLVNEQDSFGSMSKILNHEVQNKGFEHHGSKSIVFFVFCFCCFLEVCCISRKINENIKEKN